MSIGISWYVLTVNLNVKHLYLYLIIDWFIKGECFHLFLILMLLQKEGKENTRNNS